MQEHLGDLAGVPLLDLAFYMIVDENTVVQYIPSWAEQWSHNYPNLFSSLSFNITQ